MARKRRDKDAFELLQPDRSTPSAKTLLQIAEENQLFRQADERRRTLAGAGAGQSSSSGDDEHEGSTLSPRTERVLDTILWAASLAMLHFTLDVLVQHQYAVAINWWEIAGRAGQAFLVFSVLFYAMHAHPSRPSFVPGLPVSYQAPLRQAVFLATSLAAGCYLVHVTNRYGYLAVMSQAPPVGCLWVWSVIELDLGLAVLSLVGTAGFLRWGGYGFR